MERIQAAALFGLIAGLLVGLVPLVYGLMRDRNALAFGGLVASGVAGLILGLVLAIPVAAVFVFLIYRSTRAPAREPGL